MAIIQDILEDILNLQEPLILEIKHSNRHQVRRLQEQMDYPQKYDKQQKKNQ